MGNSVEEIRNVSDAEVAAVLAATKGGAILVVSTDGCVPCRLLKPVVRKISLEFSVPIFFVDGDTAPETNRRYGIDRFPKSLVFRDGACVGRHDGFSDADELRRALAGLLGQSVEGSPSAAETAFQDAWRRANARVDEIMAPASEAILPHLQEVEPEMEATMASIDAELAAGRIDRKEAFTRRKAEVNRIYAPFQDKRERHREAQMAAMETYESIMNSALGEFARAHAAGPGDQGLGGEDCAAGSPGTGVREPPGVPGADAVALRSIGCAARG